MKTGQTKSEAIDHSTENEGRHSRNGVDILNHRRFLIDFYASAPISGVINNHELSYEETGGLGVEAVVGLTSPPRHLCHAAMRVHGAVYMKLLDDAAFFAAQEKERIGFLVTVSLQTTLMRPIKVGQAVKARGRVVHRSQNLIVAESTLWDASGDPNASKKPLATASGTFMRSGRSLESVVKERRELDGSSLGVPATPATKLTAKL